MSCQVPALWVGRGKIEKDMQNRIVSTSLTLHVDSLGYVSECIQSVQCAGDCAVCIRGGHNTTKFESSGASQLVRSSDERFLSFVKRRLLHNTLTNIS